MAVHVGYIDKEVDVNGNPLNTIMSGMGDIGDRMFGTGPSDATPLDDDGDMQDDC